MANFYTTMRGDNNRYVSRTGRRLMDVTFNAIDLGVEIEGHMTQEGPVISIYETGGSFNTLKRDKKLIKTLTLET